MAFEGDIGSILFRDILGFFEYPGSPFTGNTVNDLIMFFLVPSVFIILVIYMMVGRILPPADSYKKLRILLGVTAYLFIIAGGYYRNFALIAGPYFFFLIFIMGLLYFILEHFTGRRTQSSGGTSSLTSSLAHYENMSRQDLLIERDRVRKDIQLLTTEINEANRTGEQSRLEELRMKRASMQGELREIELNLNVMKKWQRRSPFRT